MPPRAFCKSRGGYLSDCLRPCCYGVRWPQHFRLFHLFNVRHVRSSPVLPPNKVFGSRAALLSASARRGSLRSPPRLVPRSSRDCARPHVVLAASPYPFRARSAAPPPACGVRYGAASCCGTLRLAARYALPLGVVAPARVLRRFAFALAGNGGVFPAPPIRARARIYSRNISTYYNFTLLLGSSIIEFIAVFFSFCSIL